MNATLMIRRLAPRMMLWEDIEADRAARLTPANATFSTTKVGAVPRRKVVKPAPALTADPRLPSNLAAHVERTRPAGSLTKAQVSKYRKQTMQACPCRLCALALTPPVTVLESELFGTASIEGESAALWDVSHTSLENMAEHERERAEDIETERARVRAQEADAKARADAWAASRKAAGR